jgi:ParB/RepB/Spo0J family partition protein
MPPVEDGGVQMTVTGAPTSDRASQGHESSKEVLRHLPIDVIDPCPNQPRQRMAPRPLEELMASVREHGVLQPIRVRPRGGRYEIVTGERRWTAARMAGLHEIPAVISEVDDEQASIQALVENIHREDLTLIDRAQALARLRRSLGLTSWEAVGNRLGLSKGHVTRLLNVTRLAEQIREDPRLGELSEKHVRALYGLRSYPSLQIELWESIHQRGLSGDDALRKALTMRADASSRATASGPPTLADHEPGTPPLALALGATIDAIAELPRHELDAIRDGVASRCRRLRQLLEG